MLADITRKIKLGVNPFAKLHGHTKIELTDVKTGKKQVIEHDNTFQAGVLASYMRSLGAFNNNPFDNDTWNSNAKWRNLVGGILLFRDAIDDSNGEVPYMPSGNQMTANGAYGVTNAGTPVELGTWNSIESTVGASSIVMVYDWDTSHGNGTIGSICLTSETGGYIGYGNPSGGSASARELSTNQNSRNPEGFFYKNMKYRPASDGIYKSKATISEGSVFDGIETLIPYTWPENMYNFAYDYSNGVIIAYYASFSMNVQPGQTFNIIVFDCETETFTTVTCTNGSSNSINGRNASAGNGCFFIGSRYDSYSGGSPFHLFDYLTGSYIKDLAIGSDAYAAYGLIAPDLEFLANRWDNMKIKTDKTSDSSWLITNGKAAPDSNHYYDLGYDPYHDVLFMAKNNINKTTAAFKSPLYLATINNLNSPVTKDNTQTMKVTYTLTEVSS